MKIKSSPWGLVQSQYELAPGIIKVSTAGHGGIWLSPERQAQLPGWALQVPSSYCPKPMWWEEDCEAQIVMYVFWEEIEQCVGKWPAFLSKEKMAEYLWQCGYPIIPESA
jgi:hypothetical protein